MKNSLSTLKWLAGKSRPFILSIILIIVLGLITSASSISMAILSKNVIDASSSKHLQEAIWSAVTVILLIIINIVLNGIISIISTKSHEKMSMKMREELFISLSKIQWMDFSKYHSQDILTRMTSDIGTVVNIVINTIPNIFSLAMLLIGSFISLVIFEPTLAILAFMLGPIAVIFSRLFAGKLKSLHIKIQDSESKYRSFMQECISNMPIIKVFCAEKISINNIKSLHNHRLNLILKRSQLSISSNTLLSLSFEIGYFLAFFWGAYRLSQGIISFGTLTSFLQLVGQIQGPFVNLAYTLPEIISASASASRLREFEALKYEESDTAAPCINYAGIKFENVTFGYENSKDVLNNISLELKPGEIIGIIGKSGQGKTTLIRLLLSFIEQDAGQLYITTLKSEKYKINPSTRNLISYVPQGNTIFSGTIAENLRLGYPEASDEELVVAARAACAWEFIENLKDGFNTVIGERGLGLSEGQIQRITITRAFLRKLPILILDEATSALDIETEQHILKSIKNLSPNRTCIIITHRLKALEICDKVFSLDNNSFSALTTEAV